MPERTNPLTPMQTLVLQLLADQSPAEIAEQLHYSPETVKSHTREIRIRTGTHSTMRAVVMGLRNGWIT